MLVLSRKVGEEILLRLPDGRTVRVVVLEPDPCHGRQIRLGIHAPDEVRIYRGEAQQRYAPATMPAET